MMHRYATTPAFERLMLLIATFVLHPGIGCADSVFSSSEESHDALPSVLSQCQKVAQELGMKMPPYSVHTLRKDLSTLRHFGLLEKPIYRWGYYLGTGALNREELQVALNALQSQAEYQQDPQISQIYQRLKRRLRGLRPQSDLFYPVRAYIAHSIVYTNAEEMMSQSKYRETLFEKIEALESAIVKGQAIEVFRCRNPYKSGNTKYLKIYPLQLIYVNIAWYLLHEDYKSGQLAVSRLDRFSDHFKILSSTGRSSNLQVKSLQIAHHLLKAGWGLKLGTEEEQKLERCGQSAFIEVTVRFFPEVMEFILEGNKRHLNQEIREGPKEDGKPAYVDYIVKLPERSLDEFCRWVYGFMGNAEFKSPPKLVEQHQKAARDLLARYRSNNLG
ncbi:MAG: WYL domain-containing protein [Nostoc sp.]|uniref:helix-turn-helix transcriptional regulator n=1 Tax=Nostoc sp. TaxID=1180 RepID=UPI002FF8ED7A